MNPTTQAVEKGQTTRGTKEKSRITLFLDIVNLSTLMELHFYY